MRGWVSPERAPIRNPHSAIGRRRRGSRVFHSKPPQRGIRTTVPIVQEHVALILQIGDAHLGRPESARCKVAEAVEEGYRMAEAGVGIRRVRDFIEQRSPLWIQSAGEPLT